MAVAHLHELHGICSPICDFLPVSCICQNHICNRATNKCILHSDLITAISLLSVNTKLSLRLCTVYCVSECEAVRTICEFEFVWEKVHVCVCCACVCARQSERLCLINSVVYRQDLERVVSWKETE